MILGFSYITSFLDDSRFSLHNLVIWTFLLMDHEVLCNTIRHTGFRNTALKGIWQDVVAESPILYSISPCKVCNYNGDPASGSDAVEKLSSSRGDSGNSALDSCGCVWSIHLRVPQSVQGGRSSSPVWCRRFWEIPGRQILAAGRYLPLGQWPSFWKFYDGPWQIVRSVDGIRQVIRGGEDAWVGHFGNEGYPEDFRNCSSRCFNRVVYSGDSGAEFVKYHVEVSAIRDLVCIIPDA